MYTADPSAHVFEDRIYIYPSHDVEGGVAFNDNGDHFCMEDYHVFSMAEPFGEVTDHGLALSVKDVPWAARQMWAPDCAHKNGKYYFYFPAKDKNDVFYIGVAVGDSPAGPFEPQPEPIKGSFSIDPAVYEDDDGSHYLYFGGIWGGQLQRWTKGIYENEDRYPADDEPALCAKVGKLREDMLEFAEAPVDVVILDENGEPLKTGDNKRRYFEGPWVHKHEGTYYFSYSTGDTHCIAYATGDNPYGPFTYRGTLLEPVLGWTNHHSVAKADGKWYLFYHDCELSEGVTHLRSIKMTELVHNTDGTIQTISAFKD
ncbi:glycoside hydrolase family 43 protein [Marinimicrobium sp. ABcell2]|uniref:glycoside hydrolase family 43 protein n=1 Tax=Marinimicrobium sp. ABcell2 TaxID=3069751 RepID=UPI0027AE2687|nr:glycoside hydrolase family 43 protein [Marinimicrobium sp. ABcell2]MDQ2075818.1 glycoside hydrolase family 43 protein [Marinimicrobium sp. ABcell2]